MHPSESLERSVNILSIQPFLVGVCDGTSHGLIKRLKVGKVFSYHCCTCVTTHQCTHVEYFREWTTENCIIEEELVDDEEVRTIKELKFNSVSCVKIPYPLTDKLCRLHRAYEAREKTFPTVLVPPFKPGQKCIHNNHFDDEDPVASKWVETTEVTIYKQSSVITTADRKLYYRPAKGCSCKIFYDGQEDLLFNLDNKHLFYYDFLFQYLHLMIEGKNPLVAFHRSIVQAHVVLDTTEPPSLKLLQSAWWSFARLLDIDYNESFKCLICGTYPELVICDGTLIGFRKDLLPTLLATPNTDTIVPTYGSKYSDRTFVCSPKGRELLLKYSGFTKDRKKITAHKTISKTEWQNMCSLLEKDSKILVNLIVNLQSDSNLLTAQSPYSELFAELARNSPTCGIFQYCGNQKVIDILTNITSGHLNIFDSANHTAFDLLQEFLPILTKFLHACHKMSGYNLPPLVRSLIADLTQHMTAAFTIPELSSNHYLPIQENPLSFFSSLSLLIGKANYVADKTAAKQASDDCRKYASHHPNLTPGIFTVFYSHGVCYGFQVMDSYESPRHPFEIFRSRFPVAPKTIIYDNACKLHQYCLNREPAFFSHTKFLVDRFHWRGHIGCSGGYSLDSNKHPKLKEINSQVNEQANAGLQQIKGQLAYMSPDNFMLTLSLFLAVKNKDVQNKITQ